MVETSETPYGSRFMARALVLARRGMGWVRPNPPVGAVIERDGAILGEGYHRRAGEAHAEVEALRAAGEPARGATLHVTLEPCHHHGRTPPCTRAILAAGIRRVVVGRRDPNPASGSGAEALREAGVEVVFGGGDRAAAHLIAGFAVHNLLGRPRITLKVAVSLDGRIAAAGGDARWISSPEARAWVHRRRREADAMMIGAGTAVADNPSLTVRSVKGRSPDRIVVDSRLRVKPASRMYDANGPARLVATTDAAPETARRALVDRGVEVLVLPADTSGRVDLRALAAALGQRGYTDILCEGGGELGGALFQAHLVDRAWVVQSGRLLLGGGGPGWTQGLRVDSVARAPRLSRVSWRRLGPDLLLEAVPESAQWWDPETLGPEPQFLSAPIASQPAGC